jgi:hypothetical protein
MLLFLNTNSNNKLVTFFELRKPFRAQSSAVVLVLVVGITTSTSRVLNNKKKGARSGVVMHIS